MIPIIIFISIIIFFIIILNVGTRYEKLQISQSKWDSIKVARQENKNLVLEDIEFNDYNLIIDESNNALYYSVVNDSKNKYNPNVRFMVHDKKVKMVILSDKITDEKVKNNYEFKIMIYNDKEYHIYNLKCTDLPILNIMYKEEAQNKKKNIPMEIYLFNNLIDTPNKIIKSNGKLKLNEDNYVFSLNMTTPGKNVRENKISIFNMPPNSQYILKAVNNQVDNEKVKNEPDCYHINLFINNEYKGIYSLDQLQKKELNKQK